MTGPGEPARRGPTPGHLLVGLLLAALGVYTVALLWIEFATSQAHVRHYFSDVETSRPFFAINTTLSVSLLWGTALAFAFAARSAMRRGAQPAFYVSQAALFWWLGFDDRFKVHERIGFRLDVGDHYVLLAVGAAQAASLALLGGRRHLHGRALWFLAAGVALSVAMLGLDALAPHDMRLRLSLEDLAKTWAAVAFFAFGWTYVERELAAGR